MVTETKEKNEIANRAGQLAGGTVAGTTVAGTAYVGLKALKESKVWNSDELKDAALGSVVQLFEPY
jgi:hypothetical protein